MAEYLLDYVVPPVDGILDVAQRQELDPGTASVTIPFTITISDRQMVNLNGQTVRTEGRREYIALMSGPKVGKKAKNRPIKIVGITQGADDQLTVTGHTGVKDYQEPILSDTDPGQVISGAIIWNKTAHNVFVRLSTGQQQSFSSNLNLDRGGRVVLGVDEGGIERHAEIATWPPSGSRITGKIITNSPDTAAPPPPPPPPPSDPVAPPDRTPTPEDPIKPPVLTPTPKQGKVNWDAFPEFVRALDAFVPGVAGELQILGDIIAVRDAFADGFSLADPNDVRAVFGLIALIQKL